MIISSFRSSVRSVVTALSLAVLFAAPAGGQATKEPDKTKPAWKSLFDGKSLEGWKEAKFGGEGDIDIENGALIMERGNDMTGVTYANNDFPKLNYEVVFEGKRIKGNDFFCTTTFPVGDSFCSLVVGGWAGTVVGLSSIDGQDASRNATKTLQEFTTNQWYRFRIRVTAERIQAWIDDKNVVDAATKGKKIGIRAECDLCKPFGFCTWNTVGAVKDIRVRNLTEKELPEAKKELAKKRKTKFTISKETTYVLGPVDKDGYIDYAAALNERLSKGVTPANNAMVAFMDAFGPRLENRLQTAEFYRRLGVKELPEPGNYLQHFNKYIRDHHKLPPAVIDAHYNVVSERPWSAKEFPHFADWLKVNERPLAVVVEGVKRERFYYPLVDTSDEEGLALTLIPGIQLCRSLAGTLSIRARLRISEKKYDEAWQDLLACHRLGRSVAKGGTLIEGLVGVGIDSIATDGDELLLNTVPWDAKRWQACLRDLQALPPMPVMAEKINLGERCIILDAILRMDRDGGNALTMIFNARAVVEKPDPKVQKILEKIDWDIILRAVNQRFDHLTRAFVEKDRNQREKQLDQIEGKLKKLDVVANSETLVQAILDIENPAEASQRFVDIKTALLLGGYRKVQHAFDRAEQNQRNLHVAFALAAYQRDHGKYPKNLDDLAPKYLAKIPLDLFSGKALVYRPTANSVLLYSFGPNGMDDGGRWYDDDPPGDDPRIRLSAPRLAKKE